MNFILVVAIFVIGVTLIVFLIEPIKYCIRKSWNTYIEYASKWNDYWSGKK